MIQDVALRLWQGWGYLPDIDFVAYQESDGVRVEWLSQNPMPSEAEIDAFDMSAEAVKTREDAKEPDLATLLNQAQTAVVAINTYLLTADSANNTAVRAEVKAIDIRQRAIINALARLIVRMLGR